MAAIAGGAGAGAGIDYLTSGGEPSTLDTIKNYAGQAGEWLQGSTPIPGTDIKVPNLAIASALGLGTGTAGYALFSGGHEKPASMNKQAGGLANAAKVGLGALLGAGGTLGYQELNK